MSKLQQLIDELCPDGVEFKELGEIGQLYPGLSGKSKQDFNTGNSKYVTYKSIFRNTKVDLSDLEYVYVAENEKQNALEQGDVLFTGSSEIIDECGMSTVVDNIGSEKIYLNSFCFGYRFDDKELYNIDFLKHLFRSDILRKQINRTANGVTRYNISKKRFVKIEVPIPPLEVQTEIARILDTFTELTEELRAELDARKKQYEYYRNVLTTFGDDTEYNCLGDVGYLFTGLSGKSKNDFIGGNSNYVTYKSIFRNLKVNKYDLEKVNISSGEKQNRLEKGDVLFTGSSEVIDECGMSSVVGGIANEKIYLNSFCFGYRLHDKEGYDTDFLKHLFRSDDLRKQINKTANGVTRYNISKKSFVKVRIPKPNIDTQVKVAKKLDLMSALLSDINTGIPEEINMRNVQYEYYRDKLLKFDVK